MDLTKTFRDRMMTGARLWKIFDRKAELFFRQGLQTIFPSWFKNYNKVHPKLGIAQPAYYNTWNDLCPLKTLDSILWITDYQNIYQHNFKYFQEQYQNQDYDAVVQAYFPNKNTAFESINSEMIWRTSYMNKENNGDFQAYRQSDVLFADMMVNTHSIYKLKAATGSDILKKIKRLFSGVLKKHSKKIGQFKEGENVIEALASRKNLFFVDYADLREIEKEKKIPYKNIMKTTTNESHEAFIEIPFAIFARVSNYLGDGHEHLLCLGAVFNDREEVYHPFDDEVMVARDRWEMAKLHMSSTDFNYFTIRTHLGILHFASSVYTTAFNNLSKHKGLKWLSEEFCNIFSQGLLEIDFLANLTLADWQDPMAEKIFYLNAKDSAKLMKKTNSSFNILEYDPEHLGQNSYQSDAVKISKALYKKLEFYIDYLFIKNKQSWKGRTKQMGRVLFEELGNGSFDGIPKSICEDETPDSLKKIMTNLAYLWVVDHSQTFAVTSVANNFYFVPSAVMKPLSDLGKTPMSDTQKKKWLPPLRIIMDQMALSKTTTYRTDHHCLLTVWNDLRINEWKWLQTQRQRKQDVGQKYYNFWNNVTKGIHKINTNRFQKNLFNLHWLQVHSLPSSLNV